MLETCKDVHPTIFELIISPFLGLGCSLVVIANIKVTDIAAKFLLKHDFAIVKISKISIYV